MYTYMCIRIYIYFFFCLKILFTAFRGIYLFVHYSLCIWGELDIDQCHNVRGARHYIHVGGDTLNSGLHKA